MTPAVSVIVPIFNAEARLERCVQSIMGQTFSDIEILCVDDCSLDRSAEIVTSLQARDPRIKLIRHSVNLGAGGARNTGIANALAPYLAFVDSDDFALPTMIERLYAAARDGDHDIVVGGFAECDETGETSAPYAPDGKVVDMRRDQCDIFAVTIPAVWAKLWRRSLFTDNAIVFPNHVNYQDLATTPRLVFKAGTVRIIGDDCYRYVRRRASATSAYGAKQLLDYFQVFEVLKRFCVEEGIFDRCAADFARAVKSNIGYHAANVRRFHGDRDSTRAHLRWLLLLRDAYLTGDAPAWSLDMDELASLFSSDPIDPKTVITEQASHIASLEAEIASRSAELAELRLLHSSSFRFLPSAVLAPLASLSNALGRLTGMERIRERGARLRRLRKRLKRPEALRGI